MNVTDIHTAWVETRAVLGKGQLRVQAALDEIRRAVPFRLRGIDSDNGSEFINGHLRRYCRCRHIQCTRGRPYKKDDNAHIEQKNWTHVRKVLGYVRYDSAPALAAINAVYADLRLLQNLFLPTVKLVTKERVGARVRRRYDRPQTPLERVRRSTGAHQGRLAALVTPAADDRSLCLGPADRSRAGGDLPVGQSPARERAHGRCPTCGRQERVHKVVGKPQSRFS